MNKPFKVSENTIYKSESDLYYFDYSSWLSKMNKNRSTFDLSSISIP